MRILRGALFVIAFCICVGSLSAQTAAESAAVMSNAGIATETTKLPSFGTTTTREPSAILFEAPRQTSRKAASSNLIAHPGPSPDTVNRRHLEQNSGKHAGKVLFRSVPTGAEIFVNRLLVGKTPLLMFLAPGKYEIEMRGSREESGHHELALTPNQTETMVINLNQRYPTDISLQWQAR